MKSRRSLMAASVFSGKRESRESHLLHRHSLSAIRQSEPKYHCHCNIVVSLVSPRRSFPPFVLPIEIHLDPLVRQVDDR